MPLTEKDNLDLAGMREFGVFRNVEAHQIDETNGAIVVTCADGDRFADIFKHHAGICAAHRNNPRIHVFSLNGGSLLLPRSTVLNGELHEDRILLAHIQAAREMKNIHTVVLYAHGPCGAAKKANLSFREEVSLLMEAKKRLIEELPPPIKVACFFHVARDNGDMRTYSVSKQKWEVWSKGGDS